MRSSTRYCVAGLALFFLSANANAQTASAPASTPAPAPQVSSQAQLLKSAEAFVRNLYAWGPEFQVKLGPLSQSTSPEFYFVPVQVTFNGQSDTGVIYLSKDGKTILRGEMFALGKDPYAENRAKLNLKDSPSKGPADSRVVVVEFSDFECPHCRVLYQALKELEPQYPQVRFVHKDFPIVAIHPWAMTAAIGAHCAYDQSPAAFWKLYNAIFENQELISAENVWDKLQEFAVNAGLDKSAFTTCMASPEAKKDVEANLTEGQAVNINSTPTVFVNGRPIVGGDKPTLEQYINYELKSMHAPASTAKQ